MKSRYLGLWLLLASALVIFLVISFADDVSIGWYTLRKAPFREILLKDEEAESRKAAEADSLLAVKREEQERMKTATDTTPQSILLIGDSMTLNLALRLAQYAKANGHSFHAVNWDSSGTVKWAKSRHLAEYVEEYGATYVFISLGSNELYLKNPSTHRQYVDSKMAQRKKDGVHPTREASSLWIDSIARWMPKSSHPILMNTPSDSIGKVNANVKFMKATDK